jgi:outer membrane lipoprotein SlyB
MMKAFWLVLVPVLLVGCASGRGGSDYERAETRRAYEVKMGVVVGVRPVKIEGTESGVGAASGSVIGGIAGSTAGRGRGSVVGAVLGAVVGGIAGAATEEAVTRQNGVEVTVRLDSGRTIALVQTDKGEQFMVGERVRVLESGRQARVTR